MDTFDFFKASMPSTREADFYLGCLDGSVFIDFNKSKSGQIFLVRISFDGYGCCNIDDKAVPLNQERSKLFVDEISREILNQQTLEIIVKEAIEINKENIWSDAIERYELI